MKLCVVRLALALLPHHGRVASTGTASQTAASGRQRVADRPRRTPVVLVRVVAWRGRRRQERGGPRSSRRWAPSMKSALPW